MGKTGTNFAREGFTRMMEEVRKRRIDCIIVKDLSRFGRNHIETGNYIEKIFPFLGVRFIAVADNFDSLYLSEGSETLTVNLKNLVNEMYARDIAWKVKSAKRVRKEQGCYMGGVAPYGYRGEWVDGKRLLIIEETTSDIVRKIYELFLSGRSMGEIKAWLYNHGVHRPKDYRSSGHVCQQEGESLREWTSATIRRTLTNPVYTGCLGQGSDNTHDAIIGEDCFARAAAKFEEMDAYRRKDGVSENIPSEEDLFDRILFCGECGAKMSRTSSVKKLRSGEKVRRYCYNCPAASRMDEFRCEKKYISPDTLLGIVKAALLQEIALSFLRQEDLTAWYEGMAKQWQEEWRRQSHKIDREIRRIRKCGCEQYERYRRGMLGMENFVRAKKENDGRIASLQKEKERMEAEALRKNQFLQNLLMCSQETHISGELIHTLVCRVEIFANRRVKIEFAFRRKEILDGGESAQP